MWNYEHIEQLLGNTNDFTNNYCNDRTRAILNTVPNSKSCRLLIKRMIELMPNTDQQSPEWTEGANPLVTFGRYNNNQMRSCIGLCFFQQQIFLFSRGNIQIDFFNPDNENWQDDWRENDRKPRYITPLIDAEGNITAELETEALKNALVQFNSVNNGRAITYYPQGNFSCNQIDVQPEIEKKIMENQSLNTILYGAPGTGKTFSVVDYAYAIINKTELDKTKEKRDERKKFFDGKVGSQISFVTFHQSFSYEEFVEGIRAETTEDGKINYFVKRGIFKEISDKAKKAREKAIEKAKEEKGGEFKKEDVEKYVDNYVLIIDEINRGNISKIFGELITLIEESKRDGNDEALTITLPYSNKPFSVPNNLYIIGTMNTADRSLALMDTALRRRFDFIEMMPQPELLREISVGGVDIEKMLTTMNKRITVLYDREHTLGHAFFMSLTNESTIHDLANIFKNKIIPLLQEYFFEDWEKIRKVLGDDKAKTKIPFIAKEDLNGLFEDEFDDESSILYTLNEKVLVNAESYKNIYE